jgi:hypothetical protein
MRITMVAGFGKGLEGQGNTLARGEKITTKR